MSQKKSSKVQTIILKNAKKETTKTRLPIALNGFRIWSIKLVKHIVFSMSTTFRLRFKYLQSFVFNLKANILKWDLILGFSSE